MASPRYPMEIPLPASPGIEEKNPDIFYGELKDCDRCGRTFHKRDLIPQDGLAVCGACFDAPSHLWATEL